MSKEGVFLYLKRFAIAMLFLFIAGGILSYATAQEPVAETASLIVKLIDGLSADEQAAVISENGGTETSSIPALRLHIIETAADQVSEIISKYQSDARVESVEEDKTRKVDAIPYNPEYSAQWALQKIGWEQVYENYIPLETAIVAVLDTGIRASHEEFSGIVVPGKSFIDGSDGLNDPNGHGTWLSGIVGADTENGLGIAGVGYGIQLMPVTVIGANGEGQDSDIIQGVIWAADHGADVILMGFSNPDFSASLQAAIDYAWEKNIVLVAATGNEGSPDPTFPAGDRGVIGVSATNSSDALISSSNYGQNVFLAAPGLMIETTGNDADNHYFSVSGTSASAAIVAGAAALMRAVDPGLSNGAIVGRLARNTDFPGDPETDPALLLKYGNGRINMAQAFADESTEEVQPAGAAPVGEGGPYVGPYKIAGSPRSTGMFI